MNEVKGTLSWGMTRYGEEEEDKKVVCREEGGENFTPRLSSIHTNVNIGSTSIKLNLLFIFSRLLRKKKKNELHIHTILYLCANTSPLLSLHPRRPWGARKQKCIFDVDKQIVRCYTNLLRDNQCRSTIFSFLRGGGQRNSGTCFVVEYAWRLPFIILVISLKFRCKLFLRISRKSIVISCKEKNKYNRDIRR